MEGYFCVILGKYYEIFLTNSRYKFLTNFGQIMCRTRGNLKGSLGNFMINLKETLTKILVHFRIFVEILWNFVLEMIDGVEFGFVCS